MLHKPQLAEEFRETRDFAYESKFLLNSEQADLICQWARHHMQADPHGGGEHGDAYRVSSVYYETPQFAVYQRLGSYGRSKYRVRRYGEHDRVFVERKTKTDGQVGKRRSRVPIEELVHLATAVQREWPGYWFQRRLQLRHLAPVCRIDYRRVARVTDTENGACRLTLDQDVHATACDQAAFINETNRPLDAGSELLRDKPYILELKYRYALPRLFRQLLVEFAPLPQRVSKYRLAVETLKLTTAFTATAQCATS